MGMNTHMELRYTYPEAPEQVQELLTDPEFLRSKLNEVGGPGAELVSRELDQSGAVTVVQRQTVPSDSLPTYAQSLVAGDVVIERTEIWNSVIDGTVQVVVKKTPAKINGTMLLTPQEGGATLTLRIDTKVPIPLFSIAVEKLINENITRQMNREYEFATNRLRDRGQ